MQKERAAIQTRLGFPPPAAYATAKAPSFRNEMVKKAQSEDMSKDLIPKTITRTRYLNLKLQLKLSSRVESADGMTNKITVIVARMRHPVM